MNIQHLESLNDVVERITGVTQRETIPDAVVRRADEIQLVDLTPQALRDRLARGDVYPPSASTPRSRTTSGPATSTALRELALAWLADRVDEALADYRDEARHRRAVGDARAGPRRADRAPRTATRLVRRAARIAQRSKGDLVAVHVDPAGRARGALGRAARATAAARRGARRHIPGGRAAPTSPRRSLEAARSLNVTQIVMGASRRSRLAAASRAAR